MTNEAATKTIPTLIDQMASHTLNPDLLRGQSLTIRVLEWPSGYVTLTIADKAGRQIAVVQSGPIAVKGPGLSEDEAREYTQALVYRFNAYDMLIDQLRRATFEDKPVETVDELTPAKARIAELADRLEGHMVEAKSAMEHIGREYALEKRHRELVAQHRDDLENRLAEALTLIAQLQNGADA